MDESFSNAPTGVALTLPPTTFTPPKSLRRDKETTVVHSNDWLRTVIEQSTDQFWRYRLLPTPAYEYVSPSSTAIFGYTPEEFYADPLMGDRLVHPDDRTILETSWADRTAFPAPLTMRAITKGGATIWVEVLRMPFYDTAGNLAAIGGTTRDVTQRKQAEMELRHADEALAASRQRFVDAQEKLRREMAEQLHGRLQNRLLVAAARIRQAIDGLSDNPARSAERLAATADLLGEIAQRDVRQIANQLHPMFARIGLLPFLRSLIEEYEPSFRVEIRVPDRPWAIETLAQPRLGPQLGMAIYRVVEESLNNVQKHARAVSARVTLQPTANGALTVTIQDDGEGFDVDSVPPGFGILTMQDYVGSQGGAFQLHSSPGTGTTVAASFPLLS